jgi:hypothetical protein
LAQRVVRDREDNQPMIQSCGIPPRAGNLYYWQLKQRQQAKMHTGWGKPVNKYDEFWQFTPCVTIDWRYVL